MNNEKLVCNKCGASGNFKVLAIERCRWIVDNKAEYLESGGCEEADIPESAEFFCLTCNEGTGQWRPCEAALVEQAIEKAQKKMAADKVRRRLAEAALERLITDTRALLESMGFRLSSVERPPDEAPWFNMYVTALGSSYGFSIRCLPPRPVVTTIDAGKKDENIQFQVPGCLQSQFSAGNGQWISSNLVDLRYHLSLWIDKLVEHEFALQEEKKANA